jgi:hypothetical protein
LGAQSLYFFDQSLDFGFGRGLDGLTDVVRGGFGGLQEFEFDRGGLLRACRKGCRILWEFNAPKTGGGLCKLQLDVITSGGVGALASDLSDDFALGLPVGEEEELTGCKRGGETDDAAVWKDEGSGSGFLEEFTLAGIFFGARAGGYYWRFVSDGTSGTRRARAW